MTFFQKIIYILNDLFFNKTNQNYLIIKKNFLTLR